PLARPHPLMVTGGQRRVADADLAIAHDAPVVRVGLAFDARLRRPAGFFQRLARRLDDQRAEIAIANRFFGGRFLDVQPAAPAVAARIPSETTPEIFQTPQLEVLELLKALAHLVGAPRRVAGQIRDLIPVAVVRVDEDERVVRGAAAERA